MPEESQEQIVTGAEGSRMDLWAGGGEHGGWGATGGEHGGWGLVVVSLGVGGCW